MKIKFSFFYIFFTILFFNVAASAISDTELSNAISIAKSRIDIPRTYTQFSSNIQINKKSNVISLNWSGESTVSEIGGAVSANIDYKGRIIYYNNYEYGKFEGDNKLSKIDYNAAEKIAYSAALKICPEFAYSVRAEKTDNFIVRNNEAYNIIFYRYENGIPYYNNYILTVINPHNSSLRELYVNWDDVDKFPKSINAMKNEKAVEKFYQNIGISLGYDNNAMPYYYTNLNGNNYINAFTGDEFFTNIPFSSSYSPDIKSIQKEMAYNKKFQSINISELKLNIMPAEFAENYLRSVPQLGITDNFTCISSDYYADNNENYYINMVFSSGDNSNQNFEYSQNIISIMMNTITKEIIMYQQNSKNATVSRVLNKKETFDIAIKFCTAFASDKLSKCFQTNGFFGNQLSDAKNDGFFFSRKVNGLPFDGNGIYIKVDRFTGAVTFLNIVFDESINFSSAAGVIPKEQAYEELIKRVGLTLQYVSIAKPGSVNPESTQDINLVLAYSFKPGKPLFVSSSTGKLIDNSGAPYEKDFSIQYSDIENHPSKKYIEILVLCGILHPSEKFDPDEPITEGEFKNLVSKAISTIPKNNEASDESLLTNENAIQIFISMLGFDSVAQLRGIYETGFVDEGMISENLLGYAAIAKGLGIIRGNAFMPKQLTTRATAAEIIYNYLMEDKNEH